MGVFQNNLMGAAAAAASAGGGGFYTHQIANSLRLNKADSSFLTMTPSAGGDQKTWAISFWTKRCGLGLGSWGNEAIMAWDDGASGGAYSNIISWHRTGDKLNMGTGYSYALHTTQSYRDTSAWYHIVILADTTQAVAANRWKMYTNGVQIESFDDETLPPQDYDFPNVAKSAVYIGKAGGSAYSAGSANLYLAEMAFVEGTAYAIGDFGETKNGVWIPKDVSGLTFGDEGWYLKFESSSDLGNDSSGNNNDFTLTNIAADDQLIDSPTFNADNGGNYCTINPLNTGSNNTLSEGNLKVVSTSGGCTALGTMNLITGYKWYFEARCTGSGNNWVGIIEENDYTNSANTNTSIAGSASFNTYLYAHSGSIYYGSSSAATGATFTTGDVMGVLVDLESATNTIQFYKGGAAQGSAFSLTGTGINYTAMSDRGSSTGNGFIYNFGQDSTFAGAETAATNRDSSGRGEFLYDESTGGLAICSANLPTADAVDPAQTDDDYPQKLFTALTYTGDGGGSQTTGFQPDWVWVKRRDGGQAHGLWDSTRGTTKVLNIDSNAAEATSSGLTAFNSTGYTMGTYYNQSPNTYASYSWRVNGGTEVANGNGGIASTVQVDPSGGFSLVKYSGTGSASTVGHGLSSAPTWIYAKRYDATNGWIIYTTAMTGSYYMTIDAGGMGADSTMWNNTNSTSSVFSVGTAAATNGGSQLAYCWADVEGYIKSGSYEGNGNADGSFVYCGFRPAFIICKSIDSATSWQLFDDKRVGYNVDNNSFLVDTAAAEATTDMIDILSNGFKLRIATDPNIAETYIYLAIASNPFQYATAR